MKISVYDFDGTIYNGDSTKDFLLFCLKKKPSVFLSLPFFFIVLCFYLIGLGNQTILKESLYRFLRKLDNVDEDLATFWMEHENKLAQWYLNQKSNSDLIISASPEFLLKPICKKLNVQLIASLVDKKTGLYTGVNCHGAEKVQRFNKAMPNVKVYAFYSDSLSDSPMAKEADKAFFVQKGTVMPWAAYHPSFVEKIKTTYISRSFITFIFIGTVSTLSNFCFSLFFSLFIDPVLAYVGGYTISLFIAYVLNAFLIFKTSLKADAFFRFCISYIPNFLIIICSVFVFIKLLGWHKISAYILAAFISLPLTFILVKLFAFKKMRYNHG